MYLHRVQIKNFKSIKEETLNLVPRCRILVGINESGKSNILKALSLLNKENKPSKKDIRYQLPDESRIEQSHVWFVFRLDGEDIEEVHKAVSQKILCRELSVPILNKDGTEFTIRQFCEARNEGLFCVDLIESTKSSSYWSLNEPYSIKGRWKKPSSKCPTGFMIKTSGGKDVDISKLSLINVGDYPEVNGEYLEDVDSKYINQIVGKAIVNIINDNLPDCVYWTYSDAHLLPAQINLTSFSSAPNSCVPLQHMFELAGYGKINEKITEARSNPPNGIRNMLAVVARKTTQHIHSIWKEYKSVEIVLEPNGDNVDANVLDKFNRYDFAARSDGFKRFVTFLLMISTKVKTNKLENTLLIIDEPEIGLHPSGARYLRDELIRIAEKNYVIFSTHSIFMIDKDHLQRHLIVEKKDEMTSISQVNESNFVDEEVIYKALGHSIFDDLKAQNLIFEGWRDKRLFKVALEKLPKEYKKIKASFDKVGLCHLQGIKDVGRMIPILELVNRGYVILSDNDDVATEAQKRFIGEGIWKRYNELLPLDEVVTSEDFIKEAAFDPPIEEIRRRYPGLDAISHAELNGHGGKIYCLKRWLSKGKIQPDQQKEAVEFIKDEVFNNLKPSEIDDKYYQLLSKLSELF